MTEIEKIFEV